MILRKLDYLAPFMAGVGLGVAASFLLSPKGGGNTLNRVRSIGGLPGDTGKEGSKHLDVAATSVLRKQKLTRRQERSAKRKTPGSPKEEAKQNIEVSADGAKRTVSRFINKSKDVPESTGTKMERKRLRNA
jgi:hypothetical protein